ncbi:cellulase family glycosylhydrolase [Pontibacter liquoris]|uniref:cellulase family glycosylhydrolase n=1 Tax=Pontibacter liquoris TaxID=2905677 RepID=UPI001FA76A47|nr:cellulase family glycosylhydrolase [Pontibacter liquoris]
MNHALKNCILPALLLLLFLFACLPGYSQQKGNVYVDKQGVLRWEKGNKEAAFFGVNYTVPFAYGYRSHKALSLDPEKAIDQDVYHLARLGLDAFRVHVWDTEISDSTGNLLENEHLRLFDFLVYKLKQRNIKVLVTPIAFWGSGYPETDIKTAGFSSKYNKQQALVTEAAIKAQENYLRQFFRHVNPYTKLTYGKDPDVIAAEVNNEPHHSGPKEKTTEYVNRMVQAIRSTGWSKPVFYNISESPTYADAVAKANVNGFSFQWYPTGLVAGHTLQGNFLPNVDTYRIPFDTIPQFAGKARMVYEFDAGDVLQSNMYPAMVRSYRKAGFQWATQFAYDPLATAYGNTEYQTHYLNLAYTPRKAISLLIASKAFHKLPRLKTYGTFPQDTVFDVFRVSYKEQLSEMNTPEEFYYSNTTRTKPASAKKLVHVAGVGSSAVVQYQGTGAYFIDKVGKGLWRLEVMPDAIHIRDPFAKASPRKEVTRIQWQAQQMQLQLPDLGHDFGIKGINEGNSYTSSAKDGRFTIKPGTYLLAAKGKSTKGTPQQLGTLGLREFEAPQPRDTAPFVAHNPFAGVTAGKPFTIAAQVVGTAADAKVSVLLTNTSAAWKAIPMVQTAAYTFEAEVPAEIATPGLVNYRILVQQGDSAFYTFPGNVKGDPFAWDNYQTESWQTYVASPQAVLPLFNATTDRNVSVYPNLWRAEERQLTSSAQPEQLRLRLAVKELTDEHVFGFQTYFGYKIAGRKVELPTFEKLVVRGRSDAPVKVKITLITRDAAAYAAYITLTPDLQEVAIPLSSLQPTSFILMPRPYPGFQPFRFKPGSVKPFDLKQIEKLEITVGDDVDKAAYGKPYSMEVESVWLAK